ncbi:MAG: DUF4339 domain-containing protein [Candidatus Cloacimonetes bacterium]|nr:DUF4339 domain-containing protein [Candidatus Cloacimonadota bacterium]
MNNEEKLPENAIWYYQRNNQQTGPVDAAVVERLIGSGDVTRSTKVWREGMAEWQPAMSTELGAMFPKNVPPTVSPPAITVSAQRADDVNRLNAWFTAFWICLAVSIPLSIIMIGIGDIIGRYGIGRYGIFNPRSLFSPIILIGIGGIIAGAVFYCLILHRLWSLVPPTEAQTTPGKAVGFLFIPFFNLYWLFVAFRGLAKTLNAQTKCASIPYKEVNDGLALMYCILCCCSIVPFLGILTAIATMAIGIISLKQMKDAGIALIEKQLA